VNAPLQRSVTIVVGLVLTVLALEFRPMPLPQEKGRALEFVDRNGLELGTILSRDSTHTAFVPIDDIAPAFIGAIVAAEDQRFFWHGPIDAQGALRAFGDAIRRHAVPAGASTLSMQLARLLHPVGGGLFGRVEETVMAARLEAGHSKREILEAYCNRVPMGGNIYGVEAAALTYFGVHARELDVAQAALLAAIPNDPARLEPRAHWKTVRLRERLILERMVAQGRLKPDDARNAIEEQLTLRPQGAGIIAAPHLQFALLSQVPANVTVAHTTIDRPLQQFVETQLRAVVGALASHDVRDGAALVVDNRSGDVLAYAGSPNYFSEAALGRNDGVQALRQPGSALKPFLYELALERRTIRPNTILLDAPVSYAIRDGQLYQPVDYAGRFLGPVRVRIALANSLNVPAVRVLERTGVSNFLQRLHEFGFRHLDRAPEYYGLGLTLGGGEVSLYELTRAYVAMARGGQRVTLNLFAHAAPVQRMLETRPAAAWNVVTDMLADHYARAEAFGVDSILALPFPAAVKTGTSSDFRDTWTVGFTRDYTVGVWVGNFDGTPMRDVSGVTGAAPLWNRIMLHLHERSEPRGFDAPRGYRRVPICATTGRRPQPSCAIVVSEWLDTTDLRRYEAATPEHKGSTAPFAIVFPHDGDRFALIAHGGEQRIDIALAPARDAADAVTVDRRAVDRVGEAFRWPLHLGRHDIVARRGREVRRIRITVETPSQPRRPGFTDAALTQQRAF